MSIWPGKGAISLSELGGYAGVSAKVLKGMIRRGEMQAARFGREWRVPRAEAFRVIGVRDPEGVSAPPPLTLPQRRVLSPRQEAVVQRFVNR